MVILVLVLVLVYIAARYKFAADFLSVQTLHVLISSSEERQKLSYVTVSDSISLLVGNQLMYVAILLRATAECFARLCHRLGVCLSVCLSVHPSVCHTHDLYQNGASYDHDIFTVGCPKVSSLS